MKKLSLILFIVFAALACWLISQKSQPPKQDTPTKASSSSKRPPSATETAELSSLLSKLAESKDPTTARETLNQLRQALEELSPEQAAFFVESYLASGDDAELPLPFDVDQSGQLKTAPTIRTALLDHLALINPEAAAEIAREILAQPTSPDEWALALRNSARVESTDRDYLLEKTEQLIKEPEWQAHPTVGYLNAFDTLVYLGATETTPLLSEIVQRKDRQDLAHASFLTLDRLTLAEPTAMLSLIAEDRALQEARPEMAAQQMARADFRDETQRNTVRQWLLAPERTPTQLETFAATFPNGNMAISNNLLTTSEPFAGADLRDRDLRSLETIDTWIHLPEFTPIRDHIETMSNRLTNFVNQAQSDSQ